eukprot:1148238-Pelagomonas_calceolata.AAC.1
MQIGHTQQVSLSYGASGNQQVASSCATIEGRTDKEALHFCNSNRPQAAKIQGGPGEDLLSGYGVPLQKSESFSGSPHHMWHIETHGIAPQGHDHRIIE